MKAEKSLPALMKQMVDLIRSECFVPEYKAKATEEECIGLAIAHYFQWDTRIFLAFYEALEDANFHTEAEEVRTLTEKVNDSYSQSYFKKAA